MTRRRKELVLPKIADWRIVDGVVRVFGTLHRKRITGPVVVEARRGVRITECAFYPDGGPASVTDLDAA